jgi:hypothetical protein
LRAMGEREKVERSCHVRMLRPEIPLGRLNCTL